MGFRRSPAVHLLLLVAMGGALSYGIVKLLVETQLYATVAVLLGLLALVGVGIARQLAWHTRGFERELETLASQPADAPRALDALSPAEPAHRAVQSLREARLAAARQIDHARALLDTVPAALIVLRGDGGIGYMNRAALALARESLDTLAQLPGAGPAAIERLASLRPGAAEVVNFADGSQLHVSCSRYSTPDGVEQKLLALQRIAGELDAVEVKVWSDMARVLAHEIMNSLTPIASLSESLEQLLGESAGHDAAAARLAETELGAALEVIKRRSFGLMNFVERYRAVAELPAPAMRAIALKAFLEQLERLMSATFRERRIEFSAHVRDAGLAVEADAELVEQALINLLRNAVEAVAETAAPRIAVSIRTIDGAVAIDVEDNGRGLPDGGAATVLAPFYTTKAGGGGIGLNIARHVALAHGGQLEVRAGAVAGAVFTLVLPASRAQQALEASATRAAV